MRLLVQPKAREGASHFATSCGASVAFGVGISLGVCFSKGFCSVPYGSSLRWGVYSPQGGEQVSPCWVDFLVPRDCASFVT